jgi:hypothetical protein
MANYLLDAGVDMSANLMEGNIGNTKGILKVGMPFYYMIHNCRIMKQIGSITMSAN